MKFVDTSTISKVTDNFYTLSTNFDGLDNKLNHVIDSFDNFAKEIQKRVDYLEPWVRSIDNRLDVVEDTMNDYTIKSIDNIMMYDADGKLITLSGISNPILEITTDNCCDNDTNLLTSSNKAITFTATCKNLEVTLPQALSNSGSQIKTKFRNFSTRKARYKNSFDFI